MIRLHFREAELNNHFLPLTYTRAFSSLICGALTIRERWELLANHKGKELCFVQNAQDATISVSTYCIPDVQFDFKGNNSDSQSIPEGLLQIDRPWHIIQNQSQVLSNDIFLLASVQEFENSHTRIIQSGKHPFYVHSTSRIESCHINTDDGPVLIDENAFVMQGSMLRGPLYIGKHAVIKMGATLYSGTSVGHHCIVGGEIKNSIFYPYANKAHHGYIGDSIIGAWCNLGAGTTCSNLKNTVGKIKVWDIHTGSFKLSSEKMGILMGDHVRTAVNTSFNSGTVVGSFATIFELYGLSPKYIPAFSWGGKQASKYSLEKLVEDTGRWMKLKNVEMNETDKETIINLYHQLNQS